MGVEPEEEFVSDDQLNTLLERWIAPDPSRVLDKRIATSFQREFSGADGLSQSVLLPHRREEVVLMKFCSRCEEEFADKFSFCPVDGSPLTTVAVKDEEPSLTVSREASHEESEPWVRSNGSYSTTPSVDLTPLSATPLIAVNSGSSEPTSSGMAVREEYHLTIMDDSGLVARLSHEVKDTAHEYELTWPEFKRDPFGFTKRTFIGYGQMLRKFLSNRNVVLAMGAAVLGMFALVGAVALIDRSQSTQSSRVGLVVFALVAAGLLVALFSTWLGRERGAAVMGAEPSDSKSVVVAMCSSFLFLFIILGVIVAIDRRHKPQNPNGV